MCLLRICQFCAMKRLKKDETYRMCRARCSLRVKLRLQGGNSVQKKRWPFFFFDGRFVSLVTLSLSEPSLSSSSPSPISVSRCEAMDCVDRWEPPRLSSLFVEGVSLSSRAGVKGEDGSGRWADRPEAKLLRVGVFAAASSAARMSSMLLDSGKNLLLGRGVVGVVSSPVRPDGSGTVSVVLTAWNVDMVGRMDRTRPAGARRWRAGGRLRCTPQSRLPQAGAITLTLQVAPSWELEAGARRLKPM